MLPKKKARLYEKIKNREEEKVQKVKELSSRRNKIQKK